MREGSARYGDSLIYLFILRQIVISLCLTLLVCRYFILLFIIRALSNRFIIHNAWRIVIQSFAVHPISVYNSTVNYDVIIHLCLIVLKRHLTYRAVCRCKIPQSRLLPIIYIRVCVFQMEISVNIIPPLGYSLIRYKIKDISVCSTNVLIFFY